jgi:hypothetical protein
MAQAEAYYGREIEDHDEYWHLKELEQRYGRQFYQWIEEGVPTRAMGDPVKMYAYRVRKGTPIPWDIELYNQKSVQRNVGDKARERRRGPAGETSVPEVVRDVVS